MMPSEIEQYVTLMRDHKIMHMKCGDLELTLHPSAFETEPVDPKKELRAKLSPIQQLKKDLFDEEPTAEELSHGVS